jgi:seryl-tRNA synthetase
MDAVGKELTELTGRLEAAATTLERTLGWLEDRQRMLSGEVERISATVETTRREEELMAKLETAEREIAELKAAGQSLPRALEPLRKTLPTATAEMLSKHGIGESAVDVKALDAALVGLSLEQRIAVKSQLRRAGAMA